MPKCSECSKKWGKFSEYFYGTVYIVDYMKEIFPVSLCRSRYVGCAQDKLHAQRLEDNPKYLA